MRNEVRFSVENEEAAELLANILDLCLGKKAGVALHALNSAQTIISEESSKAAFESLFSDSSDARGSMRTFVSESSESRTGESTRPR